MTSASGVGALVASDSLTQKVIGEAMHVHRVLGAGFSESVYHHSLLNRLAKSGLKAESQKSLPVYFEGDLVGSFVADIIVSARLLLELKAVSALAAVHEVQLVNYLTATKIEVGLLLNFGTRSLEVKRRTLGYVPPVLNEEDVEYPKSQSSESY